MKIAIGYQVKDGPWGGGNRFAKAMISGLSAAGHVVSTNLSAPDLDIILLTDPRPRSPTVSFSSGAILRYLLGRNPRALVIHRINECDERKGTRTMNAALVRANYCADYTVFVGSWMLQLPVWRQHLRTPHSVIRNGAEAALFKPAASRLHDGSKPFRLVTHHWGANLMKGFDVYSRIDAMLADPQWQARLQFTYVGNLPHGFRFRNATHIPALDGEALAAELSSHDAYVTASINEPGGNHQNEAALCGLPLLYRNSGCLPEYCEGFGLPFDGPADFPNALTELMGQYPTVAKKMPDYPYTAELMIGRWLDLFETLLEQRENYVFHRRLWRNPWLVVRNQIPL